MTSQAFVPQLLHTSTRVSGFVAEALSLVTGVLLISLLAQVAIPLPWTPVPITGQTLGVGLVALSWGARRGSLIMLVYLLLGSLGAPIFAMGKSGFLLGPTMGYLIGMGLASFAMGALADRGYTRGFWTSLLAAYAGSVCTLGLGVLVLSFYLPSEQLLMAGLLPFLPGDLIKNTLAALTSWRLRRSLR
ncbi:MAG: biotin transporter BioY [Bdellovibrionaceae bacterium]|nr:biotin transporter BioY [Pseudobdellovibrionaceae bacterium]